MKCRYACGSPEHALHRRKFLGALAGITGLGTVGFFTRPAVAKELQKRQKHMLVIYLAGGVSQLESWDPKPGTDTGGPFRAIPTSVPGVHISELLPHTARQMHRMALVRSLNTKNSDHGMGHYQMTHGRNRGGLNVPHVGSLVNRLLHPQDCPLPGFIHVGRGGDIKDAGFLGPQYGSLGLPSGGPPAGIARPKGLSVEADLRRHGFLRKVNDHFLAQRRSAETEAYTYSYEQALRLMEQRHVFEVDREPEKLREAYGTHPFGRHCLLARRLIEHGVTYVQVNHTNYDTHHENFDFHIEQLGEFDRTFATLLEDLASRGLLEHTLVVVMSEFGRTPRINVRLGRDHWGRAWSVALAGCGIQHGAVVGKTNKNGTAVTEREVDHGHLFHTYLQALGIDSLGTVNVNGRELPVADPSREPIEELLA